MLIDPLPSDIKRFPLYLKPSIRPISTTRHPTIISLPLHFWPQAFLPPGLFAPIRNFIPPLFLYDYILDHPQTSKIYQINQRYSPSIATLPPVPFSLSLPCLRK